MRWTVPDETKELLDVASKELLLPTFDAERSPIMGRPEIERILPHRDPFLFLDDVLYLDSEEGVVAARYDLERGKYLLSGHFPNAPMWPAVCQVEGIAQAAGLLFNLLHKAEGGLGVLTHILAARFMGKVTPGQDLFVISRSLDYGEMTEVVGQTLQNGRICSVAATRFYSLSEEA